MSLPAGVSSVRVWPAWVRLLHWCLAASVIASYATHEGAGPWHERWGWVALGLAVARVFMGVCVADPHLRLRAWLSGPRATLRYGAALMRGRAPRHLGHNPLGGWMMALLLLDAVLCGVTGWLFTTDLFWGEAWLEELHGVLGHAFVPLVLLHVAGALLSSWLHRENLVAAMLHGRKRAATARDAP